MRLERRRPFLKRVVQSAVVGFMPMGEEGSELQVYNIKSALDLWEPAESKDSVDYASFGKAA